jgi:hypothetical protein
MLLASGGRIAVIGFLRGPSCSRRTRRRDRVELQSDRIAILNSRAFLGRSGRTVSATLFIIVQLVAHVYDIWLGRRLVQTRVFDIYLYINHRLLMLLFRVKYSRRMSFKNSLEISLLIETKEFFFLHLIIGWVSLLLKPGGGGGALTVTLG